MKKNSIGRAKRIARSYLSPSRYIHSKGLVDMALELSCYWGGDKRALIKAGLVHDLGYSLGGRALTHADIGAGVLAVSFDSRVIRMISHHTLGGPGMNLEEKIIYLADAIEEGRHYPGVRRIRQLAFKDLDRALLASIDSTESYLKIRGLELHENTKIFRKEIRRDYGRFSKRNPRIFRRKASRRCG